MAKIATIKDFSNMEENGVYYLEGMAARKINGKSILSPAFYNSFTLSEDTTDFTNFGLVRNGVSIKANQGSMLMYTSTGSIFEYNFLIPNTSVGQIHSVTNSETPNPDSAVISFCDIVVTKNENILYSTRDGLGIGYLGTASSGGSTTKLIDTTKNFTTLGISNVSGSDKVINLNTKEIHTITSVSTTTNANDTLNFSAGTSNAEGHLYVAFSNIGANNGGSYWNFFATTAYPHFKGQETKGDFKRQIVLFGDDYMIGNGNWLAALNINETSWDDNYKQLPDTTQFQCMGVNQDKILVGATRRGKGVMLLWDGYSDGWLGIEELEEIPSCIKAYQGGWVYVCGDSLWYSNGYQSKRISKIPDSKDINVLLGSFYNSMMVVGDRIILSIKGSQLNNRAKSGLYIYEFGSGWTILPFNNGLGYDLYVDWVGAIFSVVDYPANPHVRYIYSSFQGDDYQTHYSCLNLLNNRNCLKPSVIFYLHLPKKMNISQIILNLSPQFDSWSSSSTFTISVAIGEGKHPFWKYTQAVSGSSSTSIKNSQGNSQNGTLGHQIRSVGGNTGGERSYVTVVTAGGTTNEVLTVSPAFSATPTVNSIVNLIPLKLVDTKTITGISVPDEIPFTVEGFYSDKLFLEVYFDFSTSIKLDIHSIDIYGE